MCVWEGGGGGGGGVGGWVWVGVGVRGCAGFTVTSMQTISSSPHLPLYCSDMGM